MAENTEELKTQAQEQPAEDKKRRKRKMKALYISFVSDWQELVLSIDDISSGRELKDILDRTHESCRQMFLQNNLPEDTISSLESCWDMYTFLLGDMPSRTTLFNKTIDAKVGIEKMLVACNVSDTVIDEFIVLWNNMQIEFDNMTDREAVQAEFDSVKDRYHDLFARYDMDIETVIGLQNEMVEEMLASDYSRAAIASMGEEETWYAGDFFESRFDDFMIQSDTSEKSALLAIFDESERSDEPEREKKFNSKAGWIITDGDIEALAYTGVEKEIDGRKQKIYREVTSANIYLNDDTGQLDPEGFMSTKLFGPLHGASCSCGKLHSTTSAAAEGDYCTDCGMPVMTSEDRNYFYGLVRSSMPILNGREGLVAALLTGREGYGVAEITAETVAGFMRGDMSYAMIPELGGAIVHITNNRYPAELLNGNQLKYRMEYGPTAIVHLLEEIGKQDSRTILYAAEKNVRNHMKYQSNARLGLDHSGKEPKVPKNAAAIDRSIKFEMGQLYEAEVCYRTLYAFLEMRGGKPSDLILHNLLVLPPGDHPIHNRNSSNDVGDLNLGYMKAIQAILDMNTIANTRKDKTRDYDPFDQNDYVSAVDGVEQIGKLYDAMQEYSNVLYAESTGKGGIAQEWLHTTMAQDVSHSVISPSGDMHRTAALRLQRNMKYQNDRRLKTTNPEEYRAKMDRERKERENEESYTRKEKAWLKAANMEYVNPANISGISRESMKKMFESQLRAEMKKTPKFDSDEVKFMVDTVSSLIRMDSDEQPEADEKIREYLKLGHYGAIDIDNFVAEFDRYANGIGNRLTMLQEFGDLLKKSKLSNSELMTEFDEPSDTLHRNVAGKMVRNHYYRATENYFINNGHGRLGAISRNPIQTATSTQLTWIVPIDSKNTTVHQLSTDAKNADFDGDTMSIQIVDDMARDEMNRLFNRGFFKEGTDKIQTLPILAGLIGIYTVTRPPENYSYPFDVYVHDTEIQEAANQVKGDRAITNTNLRCSRIVQDLEGCKIVKDFGTRFKAGIFYGVDKEGNPLISQTATRIVNDNGHYYAIDDKEDYLIVPKNSKILPGHVFKAGEKLVKAPAFMGTEDEILEEFKSGNLAYNQPIRILNRDRNMIRKTTVGRILVETYLPPGVEISKDDGLNAKDLQKIYFDYLGTFNDEQEGKRVVSGLISQLSEFGYTESESITGYTGSALDFPTEQPIDVTQYYKKIGADYESIAEDYNKDASLKADEYISRNEGYKNAYMMMMYKSGVVGKGFISSVMNYPAQKKYSGEMLPVISASIADYATSFAQQILGLYNVRADNKTYQVDLIGALRNMVDEALDGMVFEEHDCGTPYSERHVLSPENIDSEIERLSGRILAEPVYDPKTHEMLVDAGAEMNGDMLRSLLDRGVESVQQRSLLYCRCGGGCPVCAGKPKGVHISPNEEIGHVAASVLFSVISQMAMDVAKNNIKSGGGKTEQVDGYTTIKSFFDGANFQIAKASTVVEFAREVKDRLYETSNHTLNPIWCETIAKRLVRGYSSKTDFISRSLTDLINMDSPGYRPVFIQNPALWANRDSSLFALSSKKNESTKMYRLAETIMKADNSMEQQLARQPELRQAASRSEHRYADNNRRKI